MEPKQEVIGLIKKAAFFLDTYKAIEALDLLRQAEALCIGNDIDKPVKCDILKFKSIAYMILGDSESCMACMKATLSLYDNNNDKAANASMMADYCFRLNQLDNAERYADMALELNPIEMLRSKPYQVKGGIAALRGEYPKAIELMNMGAKAAEESNMYCDMAMIIMDIASIFSKMGKPETALSEIYRAERYVKESRNLDLYNRLAINRATLLYKMGKDDEAKKVILALSEQRN